MGLLLHELALAPSAPGVPANGGNHDVTAVEDLMQLVSGVLPDLSETAHRSYHLERSTANTRLDCIRGIDVFDVRGSQFEEPLFGISIDQPLVVDAPHDLDVLLRHRQRSISRRHKPWARLVSNQRPLACEANCGGAATISSGHLWPMIACSGRFPAGRDSPELCTIDGADVR